MLTRNEGIWIETALKLPEDDDTARWHRAHDDQALTALLSAAGLLGKQAQPPGDSPASTTPAVADGTSAAATVAAPRRPILGIVAAGLGGLVVGALGALMLRPWAARGLGSPSTVDPCSNCRKCRRKLRAEPQPGHSGRDRAGRFLPSSAH